MGSRNISVGDKAYKRLKRLKKGKESFTDVILRLTGQRDLTRYAGSISADLADELEAASTEARRRTDEERDERVR